MLFIDPSAPNIFVARTTHLRHLKCFVKIRLGEKKCDDKSCHICRYFTKTFKPNDQIKDFLLQDDHLETILSGMPKKLEEINEKFWKHLFPRKTISYMLQYMDKIDPKTLKKQSIVFRGYYKLVQCYIEQLNNIFDYSWFAGKGAKPFNAYHLCHRLDRYTCTYCNRSYTSTVITKRKKLIVRPTLDHWFAKSTYPLLAISFHNLIPSCHPCNSSVKGVAKLTITDNTHPYNDPNQVNDFEFDYNYTSLNSFKVFVRDTATGLADNSRARKTMETMSINHIYDSNISELRDLLIIKRNYSTKYIETMQRQLKSHMGKGEVYRILFGSIYEHENYHKRPLSKFKKDILRKLGMLDDQEGK